MLIVPAIDIKDGQCVRLYQGEMDKETVYFASPVEAAKHWVEQGAEWLHVVDLNGAVEGRPVHKQAVAAICMGFSVSVQLGGGLRSIEAVEEALALGIARVILGTAAYENRDFLKQACAKFPGKIVVAIDARARRVAVKGWKENTSMDAVELAVRCEADGASTIIYTDIGRDGTREGVNVRQTLSVARAVKIPILASGGVATLEDIRRLKEVEHEGVAGVIVGRALYSGSFTLSEALEVGASRGENS